MKLDGNGQNAMRPTPEVEPKSEADQGRWASKFDRGSGCSQRIVNEIRPALIAQLSIPAIKKLKRK